MSEASQTAVLFSPGSWTYHTKDLPQSQLWSHQGSQHVGCAFQLLQIPCLRCAPHLIRPQAAPLTTEPCAFFCSLLLLLYSFLQLNTIPVHLSDLYPPPLPSLSPFPPFFPPFPPFSPFPPFPSLPSTLSTSLGTQN